MRSGKATGVGDSLPPYPEMGVAERLLDKQEKVLRIYPLEWFYR